MVLIRRSVVLGAVLLAGCSESLFGAHHGGRPADAGSDSDVPGVCTAPCVADAGAEFDGTAGGMRNHWRYLDDSRSPQRTWSVMAVGNGEMIGAGENRITSCALHPEAAACTALPGALLVSSTGATGVSDPAIEFTAPTGQVLQLSLHAFVPAGDDQTIRLYRNSREDVLFTGTAAADTTLADEITVDALPGDRILVAVAPTGKGATNVGLQLFISAANKAFPSTCQLALRFDNLPVGNSVTDLLCSQGVFAHTSSAGTLTPLMLGPAPFVELGSSGIVPATTYLHDFVGSQFLDYSQDVTVQLWVKLASFVNAGRASVFSDLGAAGAGIELAILPGPPDMLVVTTRTTTSTLVQATGSYPPTGAWHFLRVVRTAANLRVCVDGSLAANMDAAPVLAATQHMPDLGKDLQLPSNQASIDGTIDDVRVITGALPCN
ncbi:MAG TPA: LamG-like jellyroll fold domain-containing protein [Kofleriaceae bacterium]